MLPDQRGEWRSGSAVRLQLTLSVGQRVTAATLCLSDPGRHEPGQRRPADAAAGGRRHDVQQVTDAAAGGHPLHPRG